MNRGQGTVIGMPGNSKARLSAIMRAPVRLSSETIHRYIPYAVIDTKWFEQTTDEQKRILVRSVFYLKLRGMSDAQVAEISPAAFRLLLLTEPVEANRRFLVTCHGGTDHFRRESGHGVFARAPLTNLRAAP